MTAPGERPHDRPRDRLDASPDPDPGSERVTGRALAGWCAGVAGLAALVLALYGPLFEPSRLHVQDMYVDQVGYVRTARLLADTGELRNGALFPSQLERPAFYVHMPGHSATLALAYAAFGWSVFATLLPSLVSFVLAAVGTFLIGNRVGGRWSGGLAALTFCLFPANVAYAFTAMAELTFTLACVLAVALFLHLPARRRWLAPPLLLVVPFLFRESGAFLIVPLALVVLRECGWLRAGAATLGSVVTLGLVNRWQIASGKLAASLAWVTEGSYNYGDAFPEPRPSLSAAQWVEALASNTARNLDLLGEAFAKRPGELMPWCLFALFALAGVASVGGALRFRRAPFALGAGLLMLLVFVLSVTLYDVKLHKMMRTAMFTVPLGAVAAAVALRADDGIVALRQAPLRARWIARLLFGLLAGAALVSSTAVARLGAEAMTRFDSLGDRFTRKLEVLHDDDEVLVAGIAGAPYALEHYPVAWCLPPANERTLEHMLDALPVGTLLLAEPLTKDLLKRRGLVLVHLEVHTAGDIYIYVSRETARRLRRPADPGDGGR